MNLSDLNLKLQSGIKSLPPEIENWLSKPKQNYIAGCYIDSAESFKTLNPATEEVLSEIKRASPNDVDQAVQAARRTFESGTWANLSLKERCKYLRKIGDTITENLPVLALLESLDTGKPIRESLEGDIPRAAQNFYFFAEYGLQDESRCYPDGSTLHYCLREPLGVVALITPWNLPLYLATWKLAPALMMGNSVVLKPSELTPLTASYLTELLQKLDLPKGVFNLLHGFGENSTGQAISSHPGIDAISFTGETTTGRAIMRSASVGPTRLSFELGGKAPNIIFEDANLKDALEESLRAAFRNQGEICLACPRIFVHRSIYAQFVEAFVTRTRQWRVGNPLLFETQMGALISADHLNKVTSYIQKVRAPAEIVCGGSRTGGLNRGYFLDPTVVIGLEPTHPLSCEEVFGPVVSIHSFSDEDEVIRLANGTPYGLSACIWTNNLDRALRVARKIKVGMVWVNGWFIRDLRVPFGGQKKSGIGREGGSHSLDFFSEWKSICIKSTV